ncbi:MAG: hypothetical protein JNM63_04335, partial [Spirochaetia bacterium]|nr:hypothetical protein [Spirochaetia bacterium]
MKTFRIVILVATTFIFFSCSAGNSFNPSIRPNASNSSPSAAAPLAGGVLGEAALLFYSPGNTATFYSEWDGLQKYSGGNSILDFPGDVSRSGSQSARFTYSVGDYDAAPADQKSIAKRIEAYKYGAGQIGDTRWFGWSIFVPA